MSKGEYSLKLTPIATEDLEQIYNYISQKPFSDQAAKGLLEKIEKNILRLRQYPFYGGMILDTYLEAKGYRRIIVDNYVVFYTINETEKQVVIMRVLYGRQKYQDIL